MLRQYCVQLKYTYWRYENGEENDPTLFFYVPLVTEQQFYILLLAFTDAYTMKRKVVLTITNSS